MGETISRTEATARIVIRLGVSEALAEKLLDERFPSFFQSGGPEELVRTGDIFRDEINLYAGGHTHVDLDISDDNQQIDTAELDVWLNGFSNPSVATPKQPRITKYDWDDYRQVYMDRVAKMGAPDHLNVDGWRIQADVERWLTDLVERDCGEIISEATARRKAQAFMKGHEP